MQIKDLTDSSPSETRSIVAQLRLRNKKLDEKIAELEKRIAGLDTVTGSVLGIKEPGPTFGVGPVSNIVVPSTCPPEALSVQSMRRSREYNPSSTKPGYANLNRPDQTSTVYSATIALSDPVSAASLNMTCAIPTSFINQPTTVFWEIPVSTLPPNDSISEKLIGILQQERFLNIMMRHKRPPKLSFRYLFLPNSKPDDMISYAIINLVKAAGMTRIPEVIAAIWSGYRLIQWQVHPCLETYEGMPSRLKPQPSQLAVPHEQWVSHLQFPNMRDIVIERQDVYANLNFLNLFTQSIRVNWPYRDIDTIDLKADGSVVISDLFEKHILDTNNWSMTTPFTRAYPEMQWACRYSSCE